MLRARSLLVSASDKTVCLRDAAQFAMSAGGERGGGGAKRDRMRGSFQRLSVPEQRHDSVIKKTGFEAICEPEQAEAVRSSPHVLRSVYVYKYDTKVFRTAKPARSSRRHKAGTFSTFESC